MTGSYGCAPVVTVNSPHAVAPDIKQILVGFMLNYGSDLPKVTGLCAPPRRPPRRPAPGRAAALFCSPGLASPPLLS